MGRRARKSADQRDAALHVVAAALGAAIVLALAVVLLWDALDGNGGAPDIRVAVTGVERVGDAYVARVRAMNAGDEPAADVTIEGVLQDGESATLTLDYLPDGSRRTGGLIFRNDPADGVSLRVLGYRTP